MTAYDNECWYIVDIVVYRVIAMWRGFITFVLHNR